MLADPYKKLFFSLLLLFPLFSHAQVYISEIMYDLSGADTDREWVEIFNAGSNSVTITGGSGNGSWRFVDSSAHILNLSVGEAVLSAGQYAIIAKNANQFLLDWPAFSGTLFSSAISLNNTGATLSLRDGSSNTIDQVSYSSEQGASGDGNTLQKSGSNWIAVLPSPGVANATDVSNAQTSTTTVATSTAKSATSTDTSTDTTTIFTSNSSSNNTSTHYSSASISNFKSEAKYNVSAGRDRLSIVGSPLEFQVETSTEYNKKSNFTWNFGDGSEEQGETVVHTYSYPGEYSVVLNAIGPNGKAVSRADVNIVSAELAITYASSDRIDVTNNSESEANLFGRALVSGDKIFTFPKDTIISAGQKISFNSKLTGLDSLAETSASLVVVGSEVRPQEVIAKVEEERQAKIRRLSAELSALQSKLAELRTQERPRNLAKEQLSNPEPIAENAADIVDSDKSQTALVLETQNDEQQVKKDGWFVILKRFFLRKRE